MNHTRATHHRQLFAAILLLLVSGLAAAGGPAPASGPAPCAACLDQEITLGGERSATPRYYFMETALTHFAEDGTRTPGEVFKLWLEARPEPRQEASQSTRYTCRRFTLTRPGGAELELPTLGDWSYSFSPSAPGIDDTGQVFSIPHSKFALLVDSRGGMVDPSIAYMVYNNFIDFHGLNDIFTCQLPGQQGGIRDLRRIGDSVVHAAADTVAPVGLGEAMKKGSVFRNGKVTLELKGLSTIDGEPCALLEYDSGESSYLMYLEPMAGFEGKAEGASHYFGDLYVELGSGWLRRATLHEFIVSRVTNGKGRSNRSVIERTIRLETISKADFGQL